MKSAISSIILLAAIVGCSGPKGAAPTPPGRIDPPWQARELVRQRARLTKRSVDRGIDVTSYALKGRLDWEKKRLLAEVRIALTVTAPTLDRVVLDNLTEVTAVHGPNGDVPFTAKDGELAIALAGKRGDSLTFTVAYEASANRQPNGEQSALIAIAPRAGDPVTARVAATLSEPQGALTWMPCHDEPSDRAKFAVELTMPENESLIANGDLQKNDVADGVRTMAYATSYTLPNYLMAFAVGELTRYTGLHGRMPIGIWARKGVPVDAAGVIDNLNRDLSTYEKLLGAFPFEKYMIVLLPEYTGGIENAGISFQGETSSSRANLTRDFNLTAHEMGHQWFGDYMTVASWDDLWIKEGMAELLTAEAERFAIDQNHSGELGAGQFSLDDGDAIRDPSLAPVNKYTTGSYGRSAWTLTQIRALVGEQSFWGTLKVILQKHAFSSIGTEEFVTSFQPLLGEEMTNRWRAALTAKRLPRLEDRVATPGQHELTVEDPDGALLLPIELRWLDESGNATNVGLMPAKPFAWNENDSRLLIADPRNLIPLESLPGKDALDKGGLARLQVPRTTGQRRQFSGLSGPSQWRALRHGEGWQIKAGDFVAFARGLASEGAKYQALKVGCRLAAKGTSPAWKDALLESLSAPPFLGLPSNPDHHGLSECREIIGDALLGATWNGILAKPSDPSWNESVLTYAFLISADTPTIFRVASALARNAPSVRARHLSLLQLKRHLSGAYPAPTSGERGQWTAFLREMLKSVTAGEMLQPVLEGLEAAQDREALAPLATALPGWENVGTQQRGICVAKALTSGDAGAWDAFRRSLGDTGRFSRAIQKLLEQPGGC